MEYNIYDVKQIDKPNAYTDIHKVVFKNETISKKNYYIVCVPTPQAGNGDCELSILYEVVEKIDFAVNNSPVIIIKSTIPPGTLDAFQMKFNKAQFIFWPEFLREKTAKRDMVEAKFVLLGSYSNETAFFRRLYSNNLAINIIYKPPKAAELFKYLINVYLAIKVWYFNEVNEVCDRIGVEYEDIQELLPLEQRITTSHTSVPGHDGKYGFGGTCLPKEINSFAYMMKQLGIPQDAFKSIINRNAMFRKRFL